MASHRHIGPWELICKLGLDEELLKATEIRPVDGPGRYPPLLANHGDADRIHSFDVQLPFER